MRNALLMIGTLAVLSAGYYYYAAATRIDREGDFDSPANLSQLATDTGTTSDNEMVIDLRDDSEVHLAPGQETGFTVFDEFTGRPVQQFRWANWEKVAGTRNDVAVTDPELRLFTQQLVVAIKAERGQLAVDEVDRRRFRPKKGWLEGNVEITIERDAKGEETRAAVALDGLTIHLERMHFDMALGELKGEGTLQVKSPAFSLDGKGLRLVWNDVDRRVDTLEIYEGNQLSIELASGLFQQVRTEPSAAPATHAPPPPATPDAPPRRVMTYAVALLENVRARHFRGDQPIGLLTADELHLLFDMADNSKAVFQDGQPPAAETAAGPEAAEAPPTDAAEAAEPPAPERLVVQWSGPLQLAPQLNARPSGELRRHIEARGDLVHLEGNGTTIDCGGLLYREEERRLWLHPRADRPVALRMARGPAVDATSIFLDRDAGIVKLVGDVRVRGLAPGEGGDRLGIRSRLWAELHLSGQPDPSESSSPTDLGSLTLERAIFVGGVRADLDSGRALHAQRLETRFAELPLPAAASQPAIAAAAQAAAPVLVAPTSPAALSESAALALASAEQLAGLEAPATRPADLARGLQLTDAVASGSVRLLDGDQALQGTWMRINFALTPDGRTFPTDVEARGDIGLRNTAQQVYARGRRMTANLSRDGRLTDAAIIGDTQHPAVALAQTYRITGGRIDVTLDEKTGSQQPFHMRVPGQAELLFVSDRGLQGRKQRKGEPVRITARQALEFDSDAGRNQVRFLGNVVAREGDQRLEADTLTLFLKDIVTRKEVTGLARIRQIYGAFAGRITGRKSGGDGILGGDSESFRKEPLRLQAQHASLISETFVPGRAKPVVMQQISAPELTVEIPQRTVRTVGETILGMTSLRMPSAADRSGDQANTALGVPSAMISGGPSQTALMCKGSMTYVFSAEGEDRGDSVLFQGGVIFRHLAGKAMASFAELLPEVASDPRQVAMLKDRNTYLACDRLELLLQQQAGQALPGQGASLAWLNARGEVYLKDQQGAGIREVQANQIEFDRNAKTVRVLGDEARNLPAKVEFMNRETNRYEQPAVGPAFTIYLDTNTVKAEKVSGSIQR